MIRSGRPAGKVLVIGDDTRSFLAIVRSLGRLGCVVDACPFNFNTPALRSSYINVIHRLPVHDLDPARWLDVVAGLLQSNAYDLVIPCDDRSLLPLYAGRDRFPDVRIALPNAEALRVFYDKYETREAAAACDVPIAAGRLLAAGDTAASLVAEFGLPLIVKPRRSYASERTGVRGRVLVCTSIQAVEQALAGALRNPDSHLVEGSVGHHGVGLSVLCENGEVRQAFQHHRVNEPQGGGGSSYRVSAPIDPVLSGYVAKLARHVKLDGVAMFEFRADEVGQAWTLLEVNCRFWGSLPLAVNAGADFPGLLYRQLVKGETIRSAPYRLGLYGRDLAADAFNIGADVRARFRRDKIGGVMCLARHIASFGRLLLGREIHDAFSWSDLGPAFEEYRRIAAVLGRRLFSSLPFLRRVQAGWAESRLLSALGAVPTTRPMGVLFVCRGNICRSPFAEHYLRAKRAGKTGVVAMSSGTMVNTGRGSPDDSIAAARQLDIDLADHRSSHVSQAFDRPVDIVFVFDQTNVEELAGSGVLSAGTPVVPLGYLLPGQARGLPIADPYGKGKAQYAWTYANIAAAVDRFLYLLAKVNR